MEGITWREVLRYEAQIPDVSPTVMTVSSAERVMPKWRGIPMERVFGRLSSLRGGCGAQGIMGYLEFAGEVAERLQPGWKTIHGLQRMERV